MWATESEKREHFIATTCASSRPDADGVYDMVIEHPLGSGRDEDGYQHAIVKHLGFGDRVLHEQRFDHPDAFEDAFWYVDAWIESQRYSLDQRFEMQREREVAERAGF